MYRHGPASPKSAPGDKTYASTGRPASGEEVIMGGAIYGRSGTGAKRY
jgi:hypothetical protein